jgi:hypothetical protein
MQSFESNNLKNEVESLRTMRKSIHFENNKYKLGKFNIYCSI